MNKLFFDIETVPAEEEKHPILKSIHQRKIENGKKVPELDEFLSHTTFDGAFGRIICLSYAINDGDTASLSGQEDDILKKFWDIAKSVSLFVGFNIMDFDLRFIYQRSVVLKVKPTRYLNFARYRSDPIYDVMKEWSKWNMSENISLDSLSLALDIPSPKNGEVEGKNVAQAFKDGRINDICEYCEKDVEVTRDIYKRMNFI